MFRFIIVLMVLISTQIMLFAQDEEEAGEAFNLPTALYLLSNEGIINRYGVGTSGIHPVTAESEFVVDFGVASDDRWLAYRTQDGLFIHDLADSQASPILLERQPTANFPPYRRGGQTLAWSPNGSALAYTAEYGVRVAFDLTSDRQQYADIAVSPIENLVWSPDGAYLAAQADGHIWWIYRRDGYTLNLAGVLPSSVGIAWLDSVRLVFAPLEGGLFLLDLANQNEQIQLQPAARFYRYPALALDGSLIAFTYIPSDGLDENHAYWRRLTLDGANVEIEDTSDSAVDLTGFHWLPNASLALSWRDGELNVLSPADGLSIDLMLDDVIGFSWGDVIPNPVATLPINGYFLADDFTGTKQVWRINPDSTPQMLTQHDDDVMSFAISRDNNQLAYSMGGAIWLLDLRDLLVEPVELIAVDVTATDLDFSADGGTLFYVDAEGLRRVPTTLDEHSAVGLLLLNTETTTYHNPQYAPNINALLIQADSNIRQIAFFDLFSEALLMLGAYDNATWVSDGRIIAWRNGVNGAQVVLIDPSIDPPGMITLATFEGEHIYAMRQINVANFHFVLANKGLKVPNLMRVVNVPITGEDASTQIIFPTVSDPVISRNGEQVIGAYGFDRQLTLAETLETLQQPLAIEQFWWGR
jgi:WD40 repeat protein